jgi:hydrogenase maturation protease
MSGETTSCKAPILVLGLGNELLKDDAVGIRVAEKLQGTFPREVEVRWTSEFGLALLDELSGYDRVLVIDSYLPESESAPAFQERGLDSLGRANAPCPHFVGLGEIREAMRRLELDFPCEVRILAVRVCDSTTFSSEMSPQVAARVTGAAERACRIIRRWLAESTTRKGKQRTPTGESTGA